MTKNAPVHHAGIDRHGFTLPFVIIALGAVGVLALTFATLAVREAITVNRTAHAQRLAFIANSALAHALDHWRNDSLWTRPLSRTVSRSMGASDGDQVTVTLHRTHPLAVTVSAVAVRRDPRTRVEIRRNAQQVAWLAPPPATVRAAVTAVGEVTALDPSIVSGIDLRDATSPCGADRDTLSVAPFTAHGVRPEGAGRWTLMPLVAPLPVDSSAHLDLLRIAALQAGPVVARTADPAPFPGSMGTSPEWQLLSLQGPVVHLTGTTRYRGMLLVDGNLVLSGLLQLEGALIVRGALDAGSGRLTVNGAVVVLGAGVSPGQTAVSLGASAQVQFDRCRLEMALATIAAPRAAPFSLWNPGAP